MSNGRRESSGSTGTATVIAVALGGVAGSLLRYGISALWSSAWAVVVINVTGSLLIGVLMGALSRGRSHPLLRPLLGVGFLGGYTTFSTAMVDVQRDLGDGKVPVAVLLLVVAAVGSLLAAGAGWRLAARAERE